MLDKSIPYAEIWMRRPREIPVEEFFMPKGFSLDFYQDGDQEAWAKIETAVGEFDREEDALAYFNRTFLPYPIELEKRMLFVKNETGDKLGTATAWWKETANGIRYPLVHWLAIKPDYQGKGVSKPLMMKVLQVLQDLEDHDQILLHTQTWSHVAIGLYGKFGFEISDKNLDGSVNPDYQKAIEVLKRL